MTRSETLAKLRAEQAARPQPKATKPPPGGRGFVWPAPKVSDHPMPTDDRDMLRDLSAQAFANISESLERGDVTTSRWVLDRFLHMEGTRLPDGLVFSADPAETAEAIMEVVITGQLALEAGHMVMNLLERQAALQGLKELDELRTLVAQLMGDNAKTVGSSVQEQHPAWLKLKSQAPDDIGEPMNKTPAE